MISWAHSHGGKTVLVGIGAAVNTYEAEWIGALTFPQVLAKWLIILEIYSSVLWNAAEGVPYLVSNLSTAERGVFFRRATVM